MVAYLPYAQASSETLSSLTQEKGGNVKTNFTEKDLENECHMDTHLDVSDFFPNVDEEINIFTKGEKWNVEVYVYV